NETAERGLSAPAAPVVAVGPGPAGILGQGVALGAQRLAPFVAKHRDATHVRFRVATLEPSGAPRATPRVVGHRNRMAQTVRLGFRARHPLLPSRPHARPREWVVMSIDRI